MPTSVAHIIGGYAALEAGTNRSGRPGIFFLVLIVVVANIPDLDFLPGVLIGDPGLYHRGPSHSILAAVAVAGVAGWALGPRLGGARRVALWTFIAYGSHLVLDMLIPDPSGGSAGIPALWPLLASEVGTPIPGLGVLDDLRTLTHIEVQNGFFRGLLSLSGVRIFLLDAVLVLPLIPLAWGVRTRRVRATRRRAVSGSNLPLRPRRARVEVPGGPGRGRVLVAAEGRAARG
ncbi:MAG: metal-dependent hydrolase [Gemmatimonadetes bacterium]|nr:metal-dependent hydrolase [Gemmatimonadota bacterium]